MRVGEIMDEIENGSPEEVSKEAQQETVKKSKKPIIVAGAGVIIVGIAIGLGLTALAGPTKLEGAVETCGLINSSFTSLDEDGKGLFLDGEGEESSGIAVQRSLCVLEELEMPDSILSRISNTTSSMGQQEGSWNDVTILWNYHPNNGLDISFNLN
jgi:hypothetical protein